METQAALLCGLPDGSRISRAINRVPYDSRTLLLAGILDELRLIVYSRSKKGTKKPKSILEAMLRPKEPKDTTEDIKGYRTAADFERERAKILERIEKNGEQGRY